MLREKRLKKYRKMQGCVQTLHNVILVLGIYTETNF